MLDIHNEHIAATDPSQCSQSLKVMHPCTEARQYLASALVQLSLTCRVSFHKQIQPNAAK